MKRGHGEFSLGPEVLEQESALWVCQGDVSILPDYPGCPGSWTPGCPVSGGWPLTTPCARGPGPPGTRAPWRVSLTTPGARGPGPPGARSPFFPFFPRLDLKSPVSFILVGF